MSPVNQRNDHERLSEKMRDPGNEMRDPGNEVGLHSTEPNVSYLYPDLVGHVCNVRVDD